MIFDANNYLLLARELSACPADECLFEAKQRSAISRAYYSVFIRARHKRCEPWDKHPVVFRKYQESSDNRLVSIGNRLETFYGMRCEADYEEVLLNPDWQAQTAIELAEDISKLLNRI